MKWINWVLFLVYIIQADVLIFMRASLPVVSAFHPVLALVDCVLAVILVYQAWGLVREARQGQGVTAKPEQLDKIGL